MLENSLISKVVFEERLPDKCCIYNVIRLSYNAIIRLFYNKLIDFMVVVVYQSYITSCSLKQYFTWFVISRSL